MGATSMIIHDDKMLFNSYLAQESTVFFKGLYKKHKSFSETPWVPLSHKAA